MSDVRTSSGPRIAKSKQPRKDRTHWLYIGVIIAVIAGIIFGLVAPSAATEFKVVGTMFVNLIKMMISPVIFCTIVLGIGSVRAAASVGKAGGIALTYFITMSTFALAVGLVVGNLIEPGTGLNIEATKDAGAQYAAKADHGGGTVGFIQSIIPDTLFSALTSGSVLQTLFVALLVGFAVQSLGAKGEPILQGIAHVQRLVFKILTMILVDRSDWCIRCHCWRGGCHWFRGCQAISHSDAGVLHHLCGVCVWGVGAGAAALYWIQHVQAGQVPGTRVPAHRGNILVRIGSA